MNDRLYYQYGCLAWVSLTVVHICFSIASLQSLGGLPTHMSKWEWASVTWLPLVVLEGSTGRQQAGTFEWPKVGSFNLVVENFGMFPSQVELPYSPRPHYSLSLFFPTHYFKNNFLFNFMGFGMGGKSDAQGPSVVFELITSIGSLLFVSQWLLSLTLITYFIL